MYKLNQLVLLPCHESIGKITYIDKDKMVVRVSPDINNNTGDTYDVILTPEGYMPHTKVTIIENIHFLEGENVIIKSIDGTIDIGKLSKIRVEKHVDGTINLVSDFISNNRITAVEVNKCYKLSTLRKQLDSLLYENKELNKKIFCQIIV